MSTKKIVTLVVLVAAVLVLGGAKCPANLPSSSTVEENSTEQSRDFQPELLESASPSDCNPTLPCWKCNDQNQCEDRKGCSWDELLGCKQSCNNEFGFSWQEAWDETGCINHPDCEVKIYPNTSAGCWDKCFARDAVFGPSQSICEEVDYCLFDQAAADGRGMCKRVCADWQGVECPSGYTCSKVVSGSVTCFENCCRSLEDCVPQ
jgi:hypothetical protein